MMCKNSLLIPYIKNTFLVPNTKNLLVMPDILSIFAVLCCIFVRIFLLQMRIAVVFDLQATRRYSTLPPEKMCLPPIAQYLFLALRKNRWKIWIDKTMTLSRTRKAYWKRQNGKTTSLLHNRYSKININVIVLHDEYVNVQGYILQISGLMLTRFAQDILSKCASIFYWFPLLRRCLIHLFFWSVDNRRG